MIALLIYKQFQKGYFSKLSFIAVAFTQLSKHEFENDNEWRHKKTFNKRNFLKWMKDTKDSTNGHKRLKKETKDSTRHK